MNVPSPSDLAWCAGLFEGEGCFTLQRPKGHAQRGSAQLSMNDRDVVERFHRILGAGFVYETHRPDKPHPVYRWQLQRFEHLQAFISFVWPWLGQRRRRRALEVLQVVRDQPRRKMCPHVDPPRYKNGACCICSRDRYLASRSAAAFTDASAD